MRGTDEIYYAQDEHCKGLRCNECTTTEKCDEQNKTQATERELWKSPLDMRNALEESETVKLIDDNKMESEAVKLTGDNKMEFDRRPEADDNKMEFSRRPGISRPRDSHRERKQELEFQAHEHDVLVKKREFYEHMLQLGDHESAERCLSGLRERITAVEDRSANRVGGVLARP